MSKWYSRTGDDGKTGVLGKDRLPKYSLRVETLGTLDEASAALGLSRALCQQAHINEILVEIQRDLFLIMSSVAADPENSKHFPRINAERITWLETQIDQITSSMNMPEGFILPGDSLSGAALSQARTIIRRAERRAAEMLDAGQINNPLIIQYLNRLSSLCFVLELSENDRSGKPTTLAKK